MVCTESCLSVGPSGSTLVPGVVASALWRCGAGAAYLSRPLAGGWEPGMPQWAEGIGHPPPCPLHRAHFSASLSTLAQDLELSFPVPRRCPVGQEERLPAAEAAGSLRGVMQPPHPGRRPLHRRAFPSRKKIRPPLEKPVFSGTLASGRPLQVLASDPNSEN